MKQIYKKVTTMLIAILLATGVLHAQNIGDKFEVGGLYYKITKLDPKEVEATSQNNSYPYWNDADKPTGDITIPATVTHNGNTYNVTAIGDEAFYLCNSITQINLPTSITHIGEKAFYYTTNLTSIQLPENLKEIGDEVFRGSGLTGEVNLPASLDQCGVTPFRACANLTAINVNTGNLHYSSNDGVLFNFAQNTLLQYPRGKTNTTYTLPNTVKIVEEFAFTYAQNLQAITFNEGLKEIKRYGFNNCTALTSINLPASLNKLEDYAFSYSSNIQTISIGTNLVSIGSGAFLGCDKIESYTVDPANDNYVSDNGILFNKGKSILIAYPPNKAGTIYTVPAGVTTLENSAFSHNKNLETINLPEGLLLIKKYVFSECNKLSSIVLPNSLTEIGNGSFRITSQITELTIPANVKRLVNIFPYKTNLNTLTIMVQNPDDMSVNGAFADGFTRDQCTLKVPAGCKAKYEAHPEFNQFKEIIELPPIGVTSIALNKSTLELGINDTETLIASINPADATDKTLTWSSNNTAIATVDANGMVKGIANGTCIITATSANGQTATCNVSIESITPVSSITLSQSSITMFPGEKQTLTADVQPTDATDPSVTWQSSDISVATVNSSGEITAVSMGNATITAYAGNKTATCDVQVNQYEPVIGISLNKTELVITKNQEEQLTASLQPTYPSPSNSNVNWTTSDASIVTVDNTGKIKGLAVGNATITATSEDGGYKATCQVQVGEKVTGISFDITDKTVNKGESFTITPTVSPAGAVNKDIVWNTSNAEVATVSNAGVVTSVGGGICDITATTVDGGFTAICKVTVAVSVTGVSVAPATASVFLNNTQQLTASVAPSDATNQNITWSSSNNAIATVNNNGLVTGVAPGTATITVTTEEGGFTANCAVIVTNPTLNMSRYITLTVQQGQDIRLNLAADADNTPVKIVSGNNTYDITVGTDWTGNSNYIAGTSTMIIYGNIKKFDCRDNTTKLTGLDVSHNTELTWLSCRDNSLTDLDISGCSALTELWCYSNALTSLDVSGCSALTVLYCDDNNLTSLDVSKNTALTVLFCYSNHLTSIDVSNNTTLKKLFLSDNQFTSIDISNNINLEWFKCDNNQIENLDVSHNSKLGILNCQNNKLESLDVSQNNNLGYLGCFGNSFTTEAVDALFCSLLEKEVASNAKIYILNNASDTNYDNVEASNKQNAINKNWNVWYYDNWDGALHDTDIPETTGSYVCGSIAVTGVSVTPTSASIVAGNTKQLTATVVPENAINKNVTWSSDNTAVATVDNNGLVTAIAPGTANITVKTEDGGFTATCTITVKPITIAVTGVTVSPTKVTLAVGNTVSLTATVLPANATNQQVDWSSSNNAVATVNNNGVVTAKRIGFTTIYAITKDGHKKAKCTVLVNSSAVPVTGVSLDKTTATVEAGNTQQLTAIVQPNNATNKALTWSSNVTVVATVDNTGKVTAVAPGKATITVTTADGGYTAKCVVTVTPATILVTGVSLNKTTATIEVGNIQQLVATVQPNNATNKNVTWSSSNNGIAIVDNTGKVTAVAAGTANITVTTADGNHTSMCAVTVTNNTPPDTPTITVVNHCGYSVLTAGNYTGELLWSTGATTKSITVTTSGIYTLVQKVNGVSSNPASVNVAIWQTPGKPTITVEVDTLTATAASKYYWFLDDSPITGNNKQKLVIDKSGNYSVQVESDKGCKSEVSDKIYVVYSSVADQEVRITVYPNPVTDQLIVEGLPTAGNPELKLYNIAGQLIVHKQCRNSIEKIDMSDKVSGIYLLKIVDNNVSRSVKIVKR